LDTLNKFESLPQSEKEAILKEMVKEGKFKDPLFWAFLRFAAPYIGWGVRTGLMIYLLHDYLVKREKEKSTIHKFVSAILTVVLPKIEDIKSARVPISLDKTIRPPRHIEDLVTDAFAGLIAATLLGEVIHQLSRMRIKYIGAWLYQFAGFRYWTGAIWGNFIDVYFRTPLRYAYNAEFRPRLAPLRDIAYMYQRGRLEPDKVRRALAYYGIMRDFDDRYLWIWKRPLDPFSFAFLQQTLYFNKDEIEELTTDMGYRKDVVKYLTKAPLMWGLSPFKTSIRHRLMTAYYKGYKKLGEVVGTINTIWRILDLEEIAQKEAETIYFVESTDDKVDTLLDKFQKDLLTEPQVRKELAKYVVNPERIDDYVERIKVKKYKKTAETEIPNQKSFIRSVLTRGRKEGVLSQEDFLSYLNQAEKINDLNALYLFRANLEKFIEDEIDKARSQSEETRSYLSTIASTLVNCFEQKFIDEATLERELKKARQITDPVTAYKVKAYWERFYREQSQKRKEDEEETEGYLSLLASTLISCYEDGYLSKEDLESEYKKAEGIKDKHTAYLVKAEWRQYYERIKALEDLLMDRLEEGIITEGTFRSEAAKSGICNWKIDLDIAKWEIKTFGREIAESARTYRRYYALKKALNDLKERGFITDDQLKAALDKAKGITDPDEMLKLQTEYQIMLDDKKIALDSVTELYLADLIPEAEFYERLKEIIVVPEFREAYYKEIREKKEKQK